MESVENLLLIGYRGTGKTTVARQVALRLGWEWIDADVEVELAAGKSISTIFAEDGEAVFRDHETQALSRLLEGRHRIIALGGGVVLRDENRRLLKDAGTVVWLTATPKTLRARLDTDPVTTSQRPNLTAGGGLQEIIDVLAQRTELYQQCADIVVDTEKKSIDEVAAEVVAKCDLGSARPD